MALAHAVQDEKRRTAEALLGALALPEDEAIWAREARARARTRFLDAGAPARRDEYWKYTNPAPLIEAEAPAAAPVEVPSPTDPFVGTPARTAQVVNGHFIGDTAALAQDGLRVDRLAEALGQDLNPLRAVFGALEAAGQEKVARPLAALNTAAAIEGLVLHATGPVAEAVHIRMDKTGDGATLLRHLIRVEEGASLLVLESGTASNTVIEADLARGATLRHVRLQGPPSRASATHLFARIGAGARFKTFTLTADGPLTRNEVVTELAGDGGSAHVAGAVLARGTTHIDNTVFVTHGAEDCESRQVFKNVIGGAARAVFQGKIFVRPVAQRTDGYQISQSVLLEDGAEFNAKPELEIYADDVKCSHGSTTGALDRDALFYMMARGVTRAEAEALLIASFVEEAIAEIEDDALEEVMRARVADWMATR
ncbi:MAG: SufD family Fe-S cluster assembly protein [Paracoccaceae bacterium]